MLIESYGKEFTTDSSAACPVAPASTPLGATAAEILEMVYCYASDGMVFYRKGDLVNAIASFAYGYGWLDAGVYLGYLNGRSATSLPVISEQIPDTLFDHLSEKTSRYQRMLSSALDGVAVLPDTETRAFSAAQNIRTTAEVNYAEGTTLVLAKDLTNALVSFSCGYGWLDVGVRTGLFGITGDRHLFTI